MIAPVLSVDLKPKLSERISPSTQ